MSSDNRRYGSVSRGSLTCNGLKPCNTCVKRNLECLYTPSGLEQGGSQESLGSPSKRRHVDGSPSMLKPILESNQIATAHTTPSLAPWRPADRPAMGLAEAESLESDQKKPMGMSRTFLSSIDRDFDSRSRISNASGTADEAELVSLPRMLMDMTGRLLYVGDSASLSYLQLIRMIVESVSGPSEFTVDPQRHNILENTILLPRDTRPTGVLPDKKTADILVESFFTNTSGLIEVFNKSEFLQSVEECYNEPLSIGQPLLCVLNLVFAIGLVIARPPEGTDDAAVVQNLHSEPISRAELFYQNAKSIHDPVSGFEDGDFWSIQALLLMSLYMLSVSKRNAAYAYYGMAVRSAFALGLHREESMVIFSEPERQTRRNVWRTLFILDRFLSACLGRPTAISEEDCSEHALESPKMMGVEETVIGGASTETSSVALDAAVRSCFLIGSTLKKVYSKRRVSTLVAQEIADHLEHWERELHHDLRCQRIVDEPIDSAQAIAILHVNLLHCHSVLLLTRPFFLFLLKMGCDDLSGNPRKPHNFSQRLEKFSQACVETSQRTIILVARALNAAYLPQCNPFVIYFVFSAALIILSNEFASLYHNPDAENSIRSALSILNYCGQRDAQAKRVSYIIETFHNANIQRSSTAKKISLPGRKIPTVSTLLQTFQHDPISHFFHRVKPDRQDLYVVDTSMIKDRAMANMTTVAPDPSMRSMMSQTLQQPSPEGSASLNSGVATAGGIVPGVDPLSGNDSEIDFDTLWHGWPGPGVAGPGVPVTGISIAPLMQSADSFSPYGLQQAPPLPPPVPPPVSSLNANVPPPSQYPHSGFR
ncbi:fungal-specific transcription factor domain-containing protein [Durotheca rogersii]|uniref:fungal-specific transcription factor domain-containing protein n=1 Tax=Durotheca rogersii TaxID=419775 RepID=UPI002220DB92|nr:fungal-specific transcription factor domain-containing protein [Durotheca rogersii]KAI5867986.1 fungal-specific transcription factor domain-containing protein [Durotheca rogersii]